MSDKAIIFGINNYKSIIDLRGCLNDAKNMGDVLKSSMGFETDNVRTFRDHEVTWDNIVDQFDWLVDQAGPDDRLVFHFSGHGSHIPSHDDDEAEDELICLWDMDWGNPNSYILDDDLRQLTELIPDGANLTMVLDCCHSGSGTRAFGLDFKPVRVANSRSRAVIESDTNRQIAMTSRAAVNWSAKRSLQSSLKRNDRDVVLARFVAPPTDYQRDESNRQTKIRRIGRHIMTPRSQADMNHQLLAGARDDQTAADAFIDGQFNGAFTYYLCKSVKASNTASYDTVMNNTVKEVRDNGYGQVPQNEGPFGSNRIFGGDPSIAGGVTESTPTVGPPSGLTMSGEPKSEGSGSSMELLNRMLTVSEKFLDLADRALSDEGKSVSLFRSPRATNEIIVYVHGISQHRAGYSDPWFAALHPHLNRTIPKTEVLWSHVVNPRNLRATAAEAAASNREMAEFKKQLLADVRDRMPDIRQIDSARLAASPGLAEERGLFDGTGLALDDFARYMFMETIRNDILSEFDEVVRPLLQQGRDLQVISHSWGTVVAYEGLRRLDSNNFTGRVHNLFTVGSALSFGMIQRNLFQRVNDGRVPKHVQQIINLDAGGDAVGGQIGDEFTVFREYLNLEPVGCSRWPWPFNNTARSISCAHGIVFPIRQHRGESGHICQVHQLKGWFTCANQ